MSHASNHQPWDHQPSRHRHQIRGLPLGLKPLAGVVYSGRSLHTRSLRHTQLSAQSAVLGTVLLLSAITRTCYSDVTTVAAAAAAAAAAAVRDLCSRSRVS